MRQLEREHEIGVPHIIEIPSLLTKQILTQSTLKTLLKASIT
jgi:hypothetical protein